MVDQDINHRSVKLPGHNSINSECSCTAHGLCAGSLMFNPQFRRVIGWRKLSLGGLLPIRIGNTGPTQTHYHVTFIQKFTGPLKGRQQVTTYPSYISISNSPPHLITREAESNSKTCYRSSMSSS